MTLFSRHEKSKQAFVINLSEVCVCVRLCVSERENELSDCSIS